MGVKKRDDFSGFIFGFLRFCDTWQFTMAELCIAFGLFNYVPIIWTPSGLAHELVQLDELLGTLA